MRRVLQKPRNMLLYRKTVPSCTVFRFITAFIIIPAFSSLRIYADEHELHTPSESISRDNIDTIYNLLPDLEVKPVDRSHFQKSNNGEVKIKSSDIMHLSRTFGEIDFINLIKQLSGVSTTSDYAVGLSIDGSDATQAQYLINGAPVVYPYRFGGIFSTFNTPHFSSMTFQRQSAPHLPPRIGPSFELLPALRFHKGMQGSVNAGMTASSLTLLAGIADRVSIGISGRISYVDQLYHPILNKQTNALSFSFNDFNATFAVKLTDSDILTADLFRSNDNLTYKDDNYSMNTEIKWHNTLYNISYSRSVKYNLKANLYHSRFDNNLSMNMPQFMLEGPSAMSTYGGVLEIGNKPGKRIFSDWRVSLSTSYQYTTPQSACLSMRQEASSTDRASLPRKQTLRTTTLSTQIGIWMIPEHLRATAQTAIGLYSASPGGYKHFLFTPCIGLQYLLTEGDISVDIGRLQQPLHQVGFSELGLASNFWIGACKKAPVQDAYTLSTHLNHKLPWLGLYIEIGGYVKTIRNQAEYQGAVMEVIDTDYDPFNHLIISDGFNYGVSAALSRRYGTITGEVNYSYDNGKRHLREDSSNSWAPLNGTGHSLKANAVWHEGNHWELSASLTVNSGRRYTPVEALYAIGGNIAMEYGKRNSVRLPTYQRLDIGATYLFTTGSRSKLRHSINLSVLNAYGHRNVEMQYFVLNSEQGSYSLKRLYSLYRFLPSLSYSIEFK